MKITNTIVQQEANLTHNQVYHMKKNNPTHLELIKKGILFKYIESGTLSKELIKKENVKNNE